jgi:tRNA C32,U32 (ribose-2'-O)-methylase TrmJ
MAFDRPGQAIIQAGLGGMAESAKAHDHALFIWLYPIKARQRPAEHHHNTHKRYQLAAAGAAAWQYAANRFLRLPDRIINVRATATLAASAATTTRRRLAPRALRALIAPGALTATIIVIPGHERRGLQQVNVKNERPKTGPDASSGKPTPI